MVQGAVGGRDALWRWWRRERSTSSAGVGSRAEVLPPLGGDETSWAPPRPGDPAIGKLPASAQPRATLECGSASSCERVNPRMKVVQPCATGRLSDLADSAHRRAAVQQHDSVRARCGYWLRVVPSREAGSLLIRFQTTRARPVVPRPDRDDDRDAVASASCSTSARARGLGLERPTLPAGVLAAARGDAARCGGTTSLIGSRADKESALDHLAARGAGLRL